MSVIFSAIRSSRDRTGVAVTRIDVTRAVLQVEANVTRVHTDMSVMRSAVGSSRGRTVVAAARILHAGTTV
jgi:hypothetical protein